MEKPLPMEITMEMESGEETKVPTVAEARARFDQVEGVPPKKVSRAEIQPKGPPAVPLAAKVQPKPKKPVPEFVPKKVVPPVKKPAPPKPIVRPETAYQEGVKSPSPRLLAINYCMQYIFR